MDSLLSANPVNPVNPVKKNCRIDLLNPPLNTELSHQC